ncbi:MAG: TerC family protein [bacterium]|nr:TerC family protein [bacterium]MBK8127451.1 TerC family protein [bacterium]
MALLLLDLGVFNKTAHVVSKKEALAWCAVWFTLAMFYGGFVYWWKGEQTAVEYVSGYLIELSLSVDNMFVFILIFQYFKVPPKYQHRVLFWGILGAMILRGLMIALGAALIAAFDWVLYVFGAFLIYTGIRMAMQDEQGVDPDKNPLVTLTKKIFPITSQFYGEKFFIRRRGFWAATPLFVVLQVINFTDVVFALDSIPAIFAITLDPFVVFTSNVFAILGLRSLYFALHGMMDSFHYLKYGLAGVLTFIGVKMLIGHTAFAIPLGWALAAVGGMLALSIVASLVFPKRVHEKHEHHGV